MPWQRVPRVDRRADSDLRGLRKARLHADEDIEEEVVAAIRMAGVNITSARELGQHGKPDEFQAQWARRKSRFLLTRNAKDFLNDRRFPFRTTFGIIAVEGDLGHADEFAQTIHHVITMIVPWGERFEGMKLRVGPSAITLKYIGRDGKVYIERYRVEKGHLLTEVDD